jgi:hypothetical protein
MDVHHLFLGREPIPPRHQLLHLRAYCGLLLLLDDKHLILLVIKDLLLAILGILSDNLVLLHMPRLRLVVDDLIWNAHAQNAQEEWLKVRVGLELVSNEGFLLSRLQSGEDLMEFICDLIMVLRLLSRKVLLFFHRVALRCVLYVHLTTWHASLQLLLLEILLLEVVHSCLLSGKLLYHRCLLRDRGL